MIEIGEKSVEKCVELASLYSELLNKQVEQLSATMSHHAMADALVWSDELPQSSDANFKRLFIVLLQLRTRFIIGQIDLNGKSLLDRVSEITTSWAFYRSGRFNERLSEKFYAMREVTEEQAKAALDDWNR